MNPTHKRAAWKRLLSILAPYALALTGLALLAGCGGGGGGGGGSQGPTVTVEGQVTDDFVNPGGPVDGVTVKVNGTNRTTTTFDNRPNGGVDGWYSLAGVPANANITFTFTDSATNESHTEPNSGTFATTSATPETFNVSDNFLLTGPPG